MLPHRPRAPTPCALVASACLASAGWLAGCGSGGGSGAASGGEPVGTLLAKPDGSGYYLADPHASGGRSRLSLVEITWGRLVDVHALDEQGAIRSEPFLRDFLINENVQTDAQRYLLETNPITQKTRLVIRRAFDPAAPGEFAELLRAAELGLPGIVPKGDGPGESPPFSFVARNAALALRFDDLLLDGAAQERELLETVRVLSGYPPDRPAGPRLVFDANHGGTAGGAFHATRVIVDLTVSEAEAADSPVPLALNSLGLPASDLTSPRANVALRLPTRVEPGAGQFTLLRNLAGAPLGELGNGPVDLESPTRDVVRALRAGNGHDQSNGFLVDFLAPRVVGSWPLLVTAAERVGETGFAWSLDLVFGTVCRKTPVPGDIVAVGSVFLEVDGTAIAPDQDGRVPDVSVRVLNESAPASAESLLGNASYQSLYEPGLRVEDGCWLRFSPQPAVFPDTGVAPTARTIVRFSEPMDPAAAQPFDTFMHVRGGPATPVTPGTLVVGTISPSLDLKEFTFTPTLALAHSNDSASYHVLLPLQPGMTDLAGNGLASELPAIEFTVDPLAAPSASAGIVLRFDSADELEPLGFPDLRGQFTYDLERGLIRPRPIGYGSARVDRVNPIISIMAPFAPGVQTPLSPLGSKLHAVWRYADLAWSIRDETKFNLDVIGLSWSPARGQVLRDYFELFEMRLAHSRQLPDEQRRNPVTGGVKYPLSGLFNGPTPYTENILVDELSPQRIVHERALGYRIDPIDLFLAPTGMPLMPWPMNRQGGALTSFTWRDTAVQSEGGNLGAGVPMAIEVGGPLNLEDVAGSYAAPGEVPTAGLPLLLEIRCFPSENGIGLNPLAISLASNISARPNFRAFSTGGVNTVGQLVTKNPDLELAPTGGFNPNSRPPGRPTAQTADNSVYLGQLDYVVRISRAHSIWIDTLFPAPRYAPLVLEPTSAQQPPGTQLLVDVRGADGFFDADQRPFIASALDAYGEVRSGVALFHGGDPSWKSSATEVDGARYIQLRITAVGELDSGLIPELSAIGISFEDP